MDPPRAPNPCHRNVVSSLLHGWVWWKRWLTSAPTTEVIVSTDRLSLRYPTTRESWRRLLSWWRGLRRVSAWLRSLRPPKVRRPRPEPLQWWTTKLTNIGLNVRPHALPSLVVSLVPLLLCLYLLLDTVEGSDQLLKLAVQSYVLCRASLRRY